MQLALQQYRVNVFKVMAHPLRLQILELLCEGPKGVNELQSRLQSQGSTVSQHLGVLKAKHLVIGMKAGTRVVYSVQDPLLCDLLFMTKNMFNNQLMSVIDILDTGTHEQQGSDRKCKE
ncbi:metalloregulator ArsR/SmtB family transcription factor [Paenibacillus alginolyticus]|uniref:ArsR/SmtB family transcription factor n=1 Tax=Paenibacillus alginolyticus TaxID=59839 RepID=UPI000406A0A0|nr:metalloregulator ArsR/SmtB family transcription factor [Paenibacillus alginolyticus]MCY9667598.1 metalloregulator ArsR/SmtB family transcription factor [Paenibacillus alginolyticus]